MANMTDADVERIASEVALECSDNPSDYMRAKGIAVHAIDLYREEAESEEPVYFDKYDPIAKAGADGRA